MSASDFRPSRSAAALFRMAALSALALATACGGGVRSVGSQQGMPRGERYVITAAEIEASKSNNLYDAITKLRPDFLRQRTGSVSAVAMPSGGPPAGTSSSTGTAISKSQVPIRVYENSNRLTGIEDLRQIPMGTVVEVRFIPGPQAGVRYGTDHTGGVILVTTKG